MPYGTFDEDSYSVPYMTVLLRHNLPGLYDHKKEGALAFLTFLPGTSSPLFEEKILARTGELHYFCASVFQRLFHEEPHPPEEMEAALNKIGREMMLQFLLEPTESDTPALSSTEEEDDNSEADYRTLFGFNHELKSAWNKLHGTYVDRSDARFLSVCRSYRTTLQQANASLHDMGITKEW